MRAAGCWSHFALAAGLAFATLPAHAVFFTESDQRFMEDTRKDLDKTKSEITADRNATVARFSKIEERLEIAIRGQVELNNQIESLRAELARLRGQLEVAQNDIDKAGKRQTDFYVDLDGRLRKTEVALAELTKKVAELPPPAPSAPAAPKLDAESEAKAYGAALALFREKRYPEAQKAFLSFIADYPASSKLADAYFWHASTLYAANDLKGALTAYTGFVDKFGKHDLAPDALERSANCQQESNDAKGARKTLETLVSRYPASPAAERAKAKLKQKR